MIPIRSVLKLLAPPMSPQDRRAKEDVLAMAERQLLANAQVIVRLRRELGLQPCDWKTLLPEDTTHG